MIPSPLKPLQQMTLILNKAHKTGHNWHLLTSLALLSWFQQCCLIFIIWKQAASHQGALVHFLPFILNILPFLHALHVFNTYFSYKSLVVILRVQFLDPLLQTRSNLSTALPHSSPSLYLFHL